MLLLFTKSLKTRLSSNSSPHIHPKPQNLTEQNRNREGEESECLSVFSVYLSAQAMDGGD